MAFELFWSALDQYFFAEAEDLFNKLLPHLLKWESIENLEVSLLSRRAHHDKAILLFEKSIDDSPNTIFALDGLGTALFLGEGVLQVSFRSYFISFTVFKTEGKVTQDPEESWEGFHKLLKDRLIIFLELLVEVDLRR